MKTYSQLLEIVKVQNPEIVAELNSSNPLTRAKAKKAANLAIKEVEKSFLSDESDFYMIPNVSKFGNKSEQIKSFQADAFNLYDFLVSELAK
jgi:hypothetical protein